MHTARVTLQTTKYLFQSSPDPEKHVLLISPMTKTQVDGLCGFPKVMFQNKDTAIT